MAALTLGDSCITWRLCLYQANACSFRFEAARGSQIDIREIQLLQGIRLSLFTEGSAGRQVHLRRVRAPLASSSDKTCRYVASCLLHVTAIVHRSAARPRGCLPVFQRLSFG